MLVRTLLAFLLLIHAALAAQKQGSYSLSYGNSLIGATAEVYGKASNTTTSTNVTARNRDVINIFNKKIEAGRVEATGTATKTTRQGSVKLMVAGKTLWTKSLSDDAGYQASVKLDVFNPPPSATYSLGVAKVTVSGQVTAGAITGGKMVLSKTPIPESGLYAGLQIYATGCLTAKIGNSLVSFAGEACIAFSNQRLDFNAAATTTTVSGGLQYSRLPILLTVKVKVKVLFWKWDKTVVNVKLSEQKEKLLPFV